METQQEKNIHTDLFSELEQAIYENQSLRRDLTDLFTNGFDHDKFFSLRDNYTIFSGYLVCVIDRYLASEINKVHQRAKADRVLVQTNMDYYNSLDKKIKMIEDKNKTSPDLIPLRKEKERRPKVMEKLQKSMKKIDDEEREALDKIQAVLASGTVDPSLYETIYEELKRNIWGDLNNYNIRELAAETQRKRRLANSIRAWRQRIRYAVGSVAVVAGLVFGVFAVTELTKEKEKEFDLQVEEVGSVIAEYIQSAEKKELPPPDKLAEEYLGLRDLGLTIQESIEMPKYEIAAEYKPGDLIWGKIRGKKIVYQGITEQDGRPFLKFLNEQIDDQATHNHEINTENLDDGFDCKPDCKPFLGKYLFDVDLKSQRIRLLREIIPSAQNPFQGYGLRYAQEVTIPITELAMLRPEWGIPNKYLITEGNLGSGKKYVQVIWLRKTSMQIDTKGLGYLSNAVLSTPINLTNIVFDEKPDCIIEGELPDQRFYLDVNQNGDIRFLKKVR